LLSNFLKVIEDGNYYEAMIIHQETLQKNGEQNLLWQNMSNSLFEGLYLAIKDFAQIHIKFDMESKKWYI